MKREIVFGLLVMLLGFSGCMTPRLDKVDELTVVMNELSVLNVQTFAYNGFWTVWNVEVVDNEDGTETVTYTAQGKSPGAPSAKLVYTRRNLDWVPPEEAPPTKVIVVEDQTATPEEP